MTVGVLVGRFQPFHNGHLEAVRYASKKVDYVYIVIGSSQKSHERDNPFTAGERIAMIKAALDSAGVKPERWMAIPIADTQSHALWPAILKATVPPFDIVFTNDGLTTRLLKEEGVKVEAVPYFEQVQATPRPTSETGSSRRRTGRSSCPAPVASMVKSLGGVERVRSMIHKDLEGRAEKTRR